MPESDVTAVSVNVNGERRRAFVEPRKTLADFLREDCALTGTHLGCEHGVCGACTVLRDGQAVRSCLLFAVQAAGRSVRTIEGLADAGDLHPVQRAFHDHHALQCGFCTPGFIMLAVGVLAHEPDASEERLRHLLSANLCRCTGYTPILAAVLAAQRELAGRVP